MLSSDLDPIKYTNAMRAINFQFMVSQMSKHELVSKFPI